MRPPINIGDTTINPGQRRTVDLAISRLYSRTAMAMPVHVIHGKKDGPTLFVSAAIHGDEINGVEIIRRLLKLKLLNNMHGTLIAIPIVNMYGFINCSRYLPDRRDLNRSFPGNYKGSLASHLAKVFMEEVVSKCSHGIDLHSGSNHRTNLPQIRVSLDNPETEHLAKTFGAPVIIDSRLRDNSLREAVMDKGIPMLLYEGGEALRFDEPTIRVGLKGVLAVMREIGMVKKTRPRKKEPLQPVIVRSTSWIRASKSGIMNHIAKTGTSVAKGDILAYIVDPFGDEEKEEILSPLNGIVIGNLNLPLVYKGDALFHIAAIHNPETREELSESLLEGDFLR
jgi:predicted deacylase